MRSDPKRARDRIRTIKTTAELEDLLSKALLSDIDREIAKLVFVKGNTYNQICEQVGLEEPTIKKHMAHILDKLC